MNNDPEWKRLCAEYESAEQRVRAASERLRNQEWIAGEDIFAVIEHANTAVDVLVEKLRAHLNLRG